MKSNNLALWEAHEDIDPKFTKAITGRDYGGTSPNPQYVIKCLTDLFGPVGKGFGWRVVAEGFERFGETSLHWCRIEFWHTDRANVFEAYGQTKAAFVTSKGTMRVDEDAPKKSLTDAIVKAASQIGIAANIFLGRWDDQKYVAEVNAEYRKEERAAQTPEASSAEISAAKDNAAAIADLPALAAWWKGLNAHAPHVAAHPEVIAAKDARKAELQQKDAA
jgi:hypothetical protein